MTGNDRIVPIVHPRRPERVEKSWKRREKRPTQYEAHDWCHADIDLGRHRDKYAKED